MEKESNLLDLEEAKREKQQALRRKRAEASKNSGDFIEKLKKDLEKVNEQLDSALTKEKARQLGMMQEALKAKLAEAEKLHAEEEAAERAEREREQKEKAEAERKAKEEAEKVEILRKQMLAEQKTVDKRRYANGNRIEKRTEYYSLSMRKREAQMLAKAHKKGKIEAVGNVIELESTSATKEQQLKLLTDILLKVEALETKVKIQVQSQKGTV